MELTALLVLRSSSLPGNARSTVVDGTSNQISEYVVARRESPLSADAATAVRLHMVDSLACAAGGFDTPPVRIAERVARSAVGRPGGRVLFYGTESTVDLAAFANGVMVRYLDYNDAGGGGHPSDTAAALLAVADAHHLPGSRLATAIVTAYDLMQALSPPGARDRGFDQGIAVGAAVACASAAMLGGSAEAVRNALSLAIVPSVPLRQTRAGELSPWKSAATAAAARSGLFAADLAMAGMTGPAEPFEGQDGLFNRVTGPFSPTLSLDGPTAIEQSHLKAMPVEFHAQPVLEVIERLAAGLDPATIAKLHIDTYAFAATEIGDPSKWRPATRETADHSLPFLVATTLRHGRVGVDHFSDAHLRDPETLALMDRITVAENPEFTALHPPEMRSSVTLTLTDATVLRDITGYPKGHRENPMSEADIEQKFRTMAGRIASAEWTNRALDLADRICDLPDVAALLDMFASGSEFGKSGQANEKL
jgi:2-methylcitrate dehydratase